jgi:hypothetical protein
VTAQASLPVWSSAGEGNTGPTPLVLIQQRLQWARNTNLTNLPWGGSIAPDLKPSGSLRIYFQNINVITYNSRT